MLYPFSQKVSFSLSINWWHLHIRLSGLWCNHLTVGLCMSGTVYFTSFPSLPFSLSYLLTYSTFNGYYDCNGRCSRCKSSLLYHFFLLIAVYLMPGLLGDVFHSVQCFLLMILLQLFCTCTCCSFRALSDDWKIYFTLIHYSKI